MKHKKLNIIHEVGIVYKRPLFESMPKATKPEEIYELIKSFADPFTLDHKEFFWLILFSSNQVLGIAEIGKGQTQGVVVNVTEIFQLAILSNATNIALCHNHPSGNLSPSENDKKLTRKIQGLCDFLGVKLIDHLIISSEGFASLSFLGCMN